MEPARHSPCHLADAQAHHRSPELSAAGALLRARVTVAFTIRTSFSRTRAAPTSSTSSSAAFAVWLTVVTCLMCLAAGWSVSTNSLALTTRLWIAASMFLPAYGLMAFFDFTSIRNESTALSRAWTLIRWVFFSAFAVAAILMVSPLAGNITQFVFSKLFALSEWLQLGAMSAMLQSVVAQKIERAVTQLCSVGTAVVIALYLSSRANSMARQIAQEARQQTATLRGVDGDGNEINAATNESANAKQGCLGRMFSWLFNWKSNEPDANQTSSAEADATEPTDVWKDALEKAKTTAKLDFTYEWRPRQGIDAEDERYSPPIEHIEFNWLFNGRAPSSDQRAMFEAFQYRWSEHLKSIRDGRYNADRESHADLLVEAEAGAEETDAIAACAIFAAVARGQRVMILVGEDDARDSTVQSMRQRLTNFNLHSLYGVGKLSRESATEWCPPVGDKQAPVPGHPPDICVATLHDYEEVFFSGAYDSESLTALQRSLEVVIIERLDELVRLDHVRLHLPFVIDKHRLLLRNDNRAMQLVISMRPVDKAPSIDRKTGTARPRATAARRKLAERFFGGDGGLDTRPDLNADDSDLCRGAHLVYLRCRSGGLPARHRLETSVNSTESVRRWFVKRLLDTERGGVAIIGIGANENAAALREMFSAGASAPTCLSLNELTADSTALLRTRWVVLSGIPTAVELRTLFQAVSLSPLSELVIVGPTDVESELSEATQQATSLEFPVFPVAESPALFVAHLRSAVPLLRADVPTRREDFARFGLSWEESRWRGYCRALSPRLIQDNWSLDLDGGLVQILQADGTAWPAVFVRHRDGLKPHPVMIKDPLSSSLCLLPIGDSLQIGSADHLVDKRRFVTWMTSRGLELGRTDLAYFQPIRFSASRQKFRAINLRATPHGTIVEAESLSLSGGDFVVPVRAPQWVLPSDMEIDGPFSIRSLNASLFRMRETSAPCLLKERIIALATVEEKAATVERRDIKPIEFDMHVGVTMLTIGGLLPRDNCEDLLRARYEGRWAVTRRAPGGEAPARSYWPGLTRVFNYAVNRVAPSMNGLMNAYAFHPPRGVEGATIAIIEPAGTQGTALHALTVILDDEALREVFLDAFKNAIDEHLRAKEAPLGDGDELESREESLAQLLSIFELLRQAPEVIELSSPLSPERIVRGVIRRDESTLANPSQPSARCIPEPPDGAHRWSDINAKAGSPKSSATTREYGVIVAIPETAVAAARAEYGWDPTADSHDESLLLKGCVRIAARSFSSVTLTPDYRLMADSSIEHLRPLATELLALAAASNAISVREKVGVFASFVQSMRYELQREGGPQDGRWRFGVQMPVVTLHDRSGDCDSVAVLLAALLRAAGIGRTGVVLVENSDSAHAMACVEMPRAALDYFVSTPQGSFVMIECTSPCELGLISHEYVDRHVIVEAL